MRRKKSLGQHFLITPEYAQRLADQIAPRTKNLIEIGPGTGMLTQFLVDKADRLLLIEKDNELARRADLEWAGAKEISVVNEDVLCFDFSSVFDHEPFSVVGNFPYNISSQIVFKILEAYPRVEEMIGMFQYEMAARIAAGPGTKDYGIISVLTNARYESQLLFKVPPGAFDPPPKVNSAVIQLRIRHNAELPCSYQSLRTVVKAAFGMRRKMLRNSLKALFPEPLLPDDLMQKRPEQLALSDFIDLAVLLEQTRA